MSTFKLKDAKIEEPEIYLGAHFGKMVIERIEFWTMSAEKYVVASLSRTLKRAWLRRDYVSQPNAIRHWLLTITLSWKQVQN
jgi:hypothetical protein